MMNVRDERGTVLIMAVVVVLIIAGMTAAYLTLSAIAAKTATDRELSLQALYLAESGAAESLKDLATLGAQAVAETAMQSYVYDNEGLVVAQRSLGSYEVHFTVNQATQKILHAVGTSINDTTRTVEIIVVPPSLSAVYQNAIFAGNSTGDATYVMPFGGQVDQGDEITGDMYSGGNVEFAGDSLADGSVKARGTVADNGNISGEVAEGEIQPIPDLAAMDYPNNNDFNVADIFKPVAEGGQATWQYDDAGGSAWQVPEANACHILRMNPDDRTSECDSTAKNDYFLEDPYEPVRVDSNQNGTDAYHITIAGKQQGEDEGNEKIYYIDGNLWIHNNKSYSMKFYFSEQTGVRVTFVVKGNVYFSDNIFYTNKNKDAVAFVAVKDDNVEDSGNIYIGDPQFGTVKEINSFMYAENDFYDLNLDETGSYDFEIYGNMTAGNQVQINRDYEDGGQAGHWMCKCCGRDPWSGWTKCRTCKGSRNSCREWVVDEPVMKHSKMSVIFDNRIMNGSVFLPGLPTGGTAGSWGVACRREVFP